jgi:hypothetical protein
MLEAEVDAVQIVSAVDEELEIPLLGKERHIEK